MIERHEVEAAVSATFPGLAVRGLNQLPQGFDFEVYRVDVDPIGPVVFRGQRDVVSQDQGPLDFGRILLGEIRFYEKLPHLPVPRVLSFEPDKSKLGFAYAFFSYLPGRPLSDLLAGAPRRERSRISFECGRMLATIHLETADHVGHLSDEARESWGAFFGPRLRRRLAPHLQHEVLDPAEIGALVDRASKLELATPRLLHMDFRPVNMLARVADGSIEITGLVDAANCLAGDPALDVARLEEGEGVDAHFLRGYGQIAEPVDRGSPAYALYRLEAAALLARVYGRSPEGASTPGSQGLGLGFPFISPRTRFLRGLPKRLVAVAGLYCDIFWEGQREGVAVDGILL